MVVKTLMGPLSARLIPGVGGGPSAGALARPSGFSSISGAAVAQAQEEIGRWHYLVTDSGGIRPRSDSCYSKESKKCSEAQRFAVGAVVEIDRRRRAGWTKWLSLASGEGWLFDVSPKDRKVRLIEVEVQQGEWTYEVCGGGSVPVLRRPLLRARANRTSTKLESGLQVTVVERVRPLLGRGVWLRLAGIDGWVLDFVDGRQTLRRSTLMQPGSQDEDGLVKRPSESPPSTAAPSPRRPRRSGSGASGGSGSGAGNGLEDEDDDVSYQAEEVEVAAGMDFVGCERSRSSSSGNIELGEWRYVVLDPHGITLRSEPSFSKSAKIRRRLEHGELATVLERRPGGPGGGRFLRLAPAAAAKDSSDGGCGTMWAFDRRPGPCVEQRMEEAQLEEGAWLYQVANGARGCALLSRCSTASGARLGSTELLRGGELVRAGQRLQVGDATFVRLEDESSWICSRRGDQPFAHGPLVARPMRGAGASIVSGGAVPKTLEAEGCQTVFDSATQKVPLRLSPTKEPWAAVGVLMLLPGAKVSVLQSVASDDDGETWMEISRTGGAKGWVPAEALDLDDVLIRAPGWARG